LIAVPFYCSTIASAFVSCVQLKKPDAREPEPPGFGSDDLSVVQRAAGILTRLLEYRLLGRRSLGVNSRVNPWLTVEDARRFIKSGTGRASRWRLLIRDRSRLAILPWRTEVGRMIWQLWTTACGWGRSGAGPDLFGHGTAIAELYGNCAGRSNRKLSVLGQHLRSRTAIICEGVRQAL